MKSSVQPCIRKQMRISFIMGPAPVSAHLTPISRGHRSEICGITRPLSSKMACPPTRAPISTAIATGNGITGNSPSPIIWWAVRPAVNTAGMWTLKLIPKARSIPSPSGSPIQWYAMRPAISSITLWATTPMNTTAAPTRPCAATALERSLWERHVGREKGHVAVGQFGAPRLDIPQRQYVG